MARTKLTFDDVAWDLLKKYEGQFQAIKAAYLNNKNSASQYRDDVKKEKLSKNSAEAISKARALKNQFDSEVKARLEQKHKKYSDKQLEASKGIDVDEVFQEDNNAAALKAIYGSLEKNSKLLQATALLNYGDPKAIGAFLDSNIGDKDIVSLVEAYTGTLPEDKADSFRDIVGTIQDSKFSEVDDVQSMIGFARIQRANSDILHTDMFGHNISSEFNSDTESSSGYFK